MKQRLNFVIVTFIISIILMSMIIIMKSTTRKRVYSKMSHVVDIPDPTNIFSVFTPGCTMPTTNVYAKLKIPLEKPNPVVCEYNNKTISLILSDFTSIWINKDAFASYEIPNSGENLQCCYTELYRPKAKYMNESDDRYAYKNSCNSFTEKVDIVVEFIRVTCMHNNATIYVDFFAFVPLKESVEQRCQKLSTTNDKLNLLVIGIDAVSRTHFHRTMTRTADYLVNKLGAIEMLGYNKMSYNTLRNLIPALTGLNENELVKECWHDTSMYFDKCRFIWDDFKEAGYRTALIEDSVYHAVFKNYINGFLEQPTDYYVLSFLKAAEYNKSYDDFTKDKNLLYCTGLKLLYKEILEYNKQFLNTMKNRSFFAFSWSCSLTHEEFNYPYLGDDLYLSFFKYLSSQEIMNQTVLVFLSDHGFLKINEYLSIRTMQLESRQPLMYFVFPSWFEMEYVQAIRNLKANVNNLITTYDLHETMKDLLNYSYNLNNNMVKHRTKLLKSSQLPRGISLFLKIPETRTCKDAGIDIQFCSCAPRINEMLNSPVLLYFAEHVVRYINNQTANFSGCARQYLSSITDANTLHVTKSKSFDNATVDSRITISTGAARFEATALNLEDKFLNKVNNYFDVVDSVYAIDSYRERSKCIDDSKKQPFCVCKT